MTLKVIIASVLAAIILFVWGVVSWMVLPWHSNTIMHFNNDQEVISVLQKNAAQSGVYLLPSFKNQMTTPQSPETTVKFMTFAAVNLEGLPNMNQAMITGFITQLVAAFLVCLMLACANIPHYLCRLSVVILFALAAGVACDIPGWNWWRFPADFTLVNIADLVVGWFLAGIVIAAIVRKSSNSHQN